MSLASVLLRMIPIYGNVLLEVRQSGLKHGMEDKRLTICSIEATSKWVTKAKTPLFAMSKRGFWHIVFWVDRFTMKPIK